MIEALCTKMLTVHVFHCFHLVANMNKPYFIVKPSWYSSLYNVSPNRLADSRQQGSLSGHLAIDSVCNSAFPAFRIGT
jgi:hypothetical protein